MRTESDESDAHRVADTDLLSNLRLREPGLSVSLRACRSMQSSIVDYLSAQVGRQDAERRQDGQSKSEMETLRQ